MTQQLTTGLTVLGQMISHRSRERARNLMTQQLTTGLTVLGQMRSHRSRERAKLDDPTVINGSNCSGSNDISQV